MTAFDLVLPGVTPEQVHDLAADPASYRTRRRTLDVEVVGTRIRAKVVVDRSTQPELRGWLTPVPEGTLVEGRLHYARPLAYVVAYGAMTLFSVLFAAYLAQRGEWTAFAVVGVGALLLLVVTWLSMHAGVAHKDDDEDWLQGELTRFFDPARRTGTLEE